MARSLSSPKVLNICSPTVEAWDEAVQGFNSEENLSGYKIDAIAESVQQAILLCEQVNAEPKLAFVTEKAKKLQKLFEKLAHELRSAETQKAMTSITADRDLRDFLSVSATEASLGTAMLNAVQSMQTPFNDWIFRNGRNPGGRPVQTERQALLYCLIKNYEDIFATPLCDRAKLRLIALSTHLFPSCQVSTDGLEDAVSRAVKGFASWAIWARLPTLQPHDQSLLESWNERNPNDPEPPLPPAKPRAKQ